MILFQSISLQRCVLFQEFYKLADLHKEREFVARHIETVAPKNIKATGLGRRKKSHLYFLTVNRQRSAHTSVGTHFWQLWVLVRNLFELS